MFLKKILCMVVGHEPETMRFLENEPNVGIVRCAQCGVEFIFHRPTGFVLPWKPEAETFYAERAAWRRAANQA